MPEELTPAAKALRFFLSEKGFSIARASAEIGMNRQTLNARLSPQVPLDLARPTAQSLVNKLLAALDVPPADFLAKVREFDASSATDGASVDLLLDVYVHDGDAASATFERLLLAVVYDCRQPETERTSARDELDAYYSGAEGGNSERRVLLRTLFDCSGSDVLRQKIYRLFMGNPASLGAGLGTSQENQT